MTACLVLRMEIDSIIATTDLISEDVIGDCKQVVSGRTEVSKSNMIDLYDEDSLSSSDDSQLTVEFSQIALLIGCP